jgi:NAD+ kinase
MKRIGIFFHPLKDAACSLAWELTEFLRGQHLSVWQCSAWEWENALPQINGSDLIITVGGDGTILRAAQAIMPNPIPILGINLGRLGFMTELTVGETMEKILLILKGEGEIDERSILEADVKTSRDKALHHFYALNDVVVARGGTARLVNIDASIDGAPLTTYRADGVVIATATGCTGYALAAGGPILHPQSTDFVMAPILPFLSYSYPMVIPANSISRLALGTNTSGIISIDGHINIDLAGGDVVTVKHSTGTVRFLRVHHHSFYETLEQRLKGKHPDDARRES